MKISIMTSTGDDDLINAEEKGDLEYSKQQLKRLQEEVVDIEDMSDGISIMDLGLNEFRLDLLEYLKTHPSMDKMPRGLHTVVPATDELHEGIILILKNVNNSINIDEQNRIHPFYMVYISMDGEVFEVKLNVPNLDDGFLRQIDKELPYHMLFLLEYNGKQKSVIGYKEESSGNTAFKVNRDYSTGWQEADSLALKVDGFSVDAIYENFIRQIAGEALVTAARAKA